MGGGGPLDLTGQLVALGGVPVQFAAELLMPQEVVRRSADELSDSALAAKFQVSVEAMRYRLEPRGPAMTEDGEAAPPPRGRAEPEPALSEQEARQAASDTTPDEVKEIVRHANLGQDYITDDRCKLILLDAAKALAAQGDWTTALGLFVGLFVAVVTSDPKDKVLGSDGHEVEG